MNADPDKHAKWRRDFHDVRGFAFLCENRAEWVRYRPQVAEILGTWFHNPVAPRYAPPPPYPFPRVSI